VQSYAIYFYRASILTIIFSRILRTFGAFGAIALNDSRLAENQKLKIFWVKNMRLPAEGNRMFI
jgi:hypothetical protein